MMGAMYIFYGSLVTLLGMLSFAYLERRVGRRIVLRRLREENDDRIVFFAETIVRSVRTGTKAGVRIVAHVSRGILSIFARSMHVLSLKIHNAVNPRRDTLKERGAMSNFLKSITEHKENIRNGNV